MKWDGAMIDNHLMTGIEMVLMGRKIAGTLPEGVEACRLVEQELDRLLAEGKIAEGSCDCGRPTCRTVSWQLTPEGEAEMDRVGLEGLSQIFARAFDVPAEDVEVQVVQVPASAFPPVDPRLN